MPGKKKIAVIGGGIAGLAAACTLVKNGFSVEVFEDKEYVGGRMRTDRSRNGYAIDTGAQFFYDVYKNTFTLCRELGISDQLQKFERPYGIYRGGKIHRLDPAAKNPLSIVTFSALSASSKFKLLKLLPVLVRNYRRLNFHRPDLWETFDNEDAAAYTLRRFNREFLECFVQPLISGLTLSEPENISVAVMLSGLKFQLLYKLYTLKNGIGTLPEKLAQRCDVHTYTKVNRILFDGNRAIGIELTEKVRGDSVPGSKKVLDYDAVVCAIPAGAAAAILPDAPTEITSFFKGVEYSRGVAAVFGLDNKLMNDMYAVAVPRENGFAITAFSENTNKAASLAPPGAGLVVVFPSGTAGNTMLNEADEEIVKKISEEIKTIVPSFPEAPVFTKVYRWDPALLLFTKGYLSRVKKFRIDIKKLQGIFFAGDYLATASVEGSLTSGLEAAEMVKKYVVKY